LVDLRIGRRRDLAEDFVKRRHGGKRRDRGCNKKRER
jgi:hypothetical protein